MRLFVLYYLLFFNKALSIQGVASHFVLGLEPRWCVTRGDLKDLREEVIKAIQEHVFVFARGSWTVCCFN